MHLHQGATLVFQSSQQANRCIAWCFAQSSSLTASQLRSPGFSWYDLWYPASSDRYGAARASPSFVAYLFVAEAVGSSGRSRIALLDVPAHPQLAVYAVWDAAHGSGVSRLAVLNLAPRNETTNARDAAAVAVELDLSEFGNVTTGALVKRMQSPGLSSKVSLYAADKLYDH
jgi:hypothetical protein